VQPGSLEIDISIDRLNVEEDGTCDQCRSPSAAAVFNRGSPAFRQFIWQLTSRYQMLEQAAREGRDVDVWPCSIPSSPGTGPDLIG
jgi:hypothetical protein